MLSDAAIALYNHMMHHYAEHNELPTAMQLVRGYGYASTRAVYDLFDTLRRWEWLRRNPDTWQMELTRPTERGLTPEQLRALIAGMPVYTYWKA